MSEIENPIARFVNTRLSVLRITRVELVERCGYLNLSKGLRRLDEVMEGNFTRSEMLMAALPDALRIEPSTVQAALIATKQAKQRMQEERYREAFKPHAVVVCERSIPDPIWLAAILGIDTLLRVDFEAGSSPLTYPRQSYEGLRTKLRKWDARVIPAFGRPVGFAVLYRPHEAVDFDLNCVALRRSNGAPYVRRASLSIRGQGAGL